MSEMADRQNGEPLRDRAVRLFSFLREMTLLRTKVIKSIEQYDNVIWLAEIPREPGCHCAAWGTATASEENQAWIEVRKPRMAPPPEPPAKVVPYRLPFSSKIRPPEG